MAKDYNDINIFCSVLNCLEDGMYDVTGVTRVFLTYAEAHNIDEVDVVRIKEFVTKHGRENVWYAAPGETYGIYLFATKPTEFSHDNARGSVGRGANLLVTECPKELLILAEND